MRLRVRFDTPDAWIAFYIEGEGAGAPHVVTACINRKHRAHSLSVIKHARGKHVGFHEGVYNWEAPAALAELFADILYNEGIMITTEQAHKLRALIEQYRDAELNDSWKGSGDPADREQIEQELKETKRDLELFIHELEHGTVPQPIKLVEAIR